MLRYQWMRSTLSTMSDLELLKNIVDKIKPKIGAVDTETTGLHIINDKPFVVQFGFLDEPNKRGFSFAVDLEQTPELANKVLEYWTEAAKDLKLYLGQNIKFDLHMLANIGFEYKKENLSDTMFYIRFAHDALHDNEGGAPLGLKEYTSKYIDPSAKSHEKKLKVERSKIAKDYNMLLSQMLKQRGLKYKLSDIQKMFNDTIFEIDDLNKDIKPVYLDWLNSLPLYIQAKIQSLVEADMIRYSDLNRETLIEYAHYDIIYTLEIYASLQHIIINRKQEEALKIENSCIIPWYEMERTGFLADKEYLEEARKNLKAYIIKQRNKFHELAGEDITVGQHAAIKRILKERYNLEVESTGSERLDLIKNKHKDEPVYIFIDIIQELRTLEKWYSTYIIRFQNDLKTSDRLYTSINQVGAVSGRVTSDFQQFPKQAITTYDGQELFHPRKVIKTNTNIVYLDYSQIELRFQALYTILLGHPDLNMCRAYMPFNCVDSNGTPFDHKTNPLFTGKDWFHKEDTSVKWHPVDIHGATTTKATGLTPDDPNFSRLRTEIGKKVNFAKNYGAELSRIRQMFPDKSYEECVKINDAYYAAFPGIKLYHKYCIERAQKYSFTTNLFQVKYYGASGHKLKNLLIQGSAAYFLKLKIRELYDYCKEHNIKTQFQMQIHDELSWEYNPEDPPEIFFKFKEIMEDAKTSIPIVADMEITSTNWAEKEEVDTLEELKEKIK